MGCDVGHREFSARAISIQHSALSIQPYEELAGMKDFRDLQVWEKAHSLTLMSYRSTVAFPKAETYGLTTQIQRFLNIACGSASELEYHFLLARDLAFLSDMEYQKLNQAVVEVKRMLASLARKVDADRLAG
jgi:hypothetical protein